MSNFEFGSFPGLVICGMIISCDAGQWQQAAAPRQPQNHEGKQPICLLSAPMQLFRFSLSVQYSINYMRYSTFYYKIGFVLGDFTSL